MTHNIPVSEINELISSCDERMAKIEGDLGEVKDMLKQLLAQNAGTN